LYFLTAEKINIERSFMNKARSQNIALFLPSLLGGGAERVIVTLANGIADKGIKVDLILANAEGPYLSEVSSKIRVVDLKTKRVLFSLFSLVKYLKQEHPTVLLSSLEHANIIALWAKWLSGEKTKCVIRIPNTTSIDAQYSNNLIGKFLPWFLKLFYWLADSIVVVSKYSAQDLITFLGIPPSKVCVIYNPVINDELFRKSVIELHHPWFNDGTIPVILGVGRLSRQKDFPTLIRAFALLRKNRFVRLMILGEGEDRKYLEGLISELGIQEDVSLPGFVENPFPYIRRASVFALSSRWEGLPNALIQALALGTPSVATDCPGGVAEILEGNKLGVLVPVGDERKIADALRISIDSKRLSVDIGIARFNSEAIINQYFYLIKSL